MLVACVSVDDRCHREWQKRKPLSEPSSKDPKQAQTLPLADNPALDDLVAKARSKSYCRQLVSEMWMVTLLCTEDRQTQEAEENMTDEEREAKRKAEGKAEAQKQGKT